MKFGCRVVSYAFEAQEPICIPPGKAGNMLRGAFGLLPDIASIFRPAPAEPSGLKDPPRPFVFRASHLDGHNIKPGERFHFEVHLFDRKIPADTFSAIWSNRAKFLALEIEKVEIDFHPEPATTAIVKFLTPTELKPAGDPEFKILIARCRDRVSTLRALYGPGPLPIKFRELTQQAEQVRMVDLDLKFVHFERTSSRTGETHPIGGFTGIARYEGHLDEFVPYLRSAEYTGVGRHTVWGKGVIAVEIS